MLRPLSILILCSCLLSYLPAFADDAQPSLPEKSNLFGGPFRVELRAGYTGTMWTPKGLEPYQVEKYGRELYYGELAVLHPLLIMGEAFDVIQLPRLRIETNLGYTRTDGAFEEMIPSSLKENAYLKTTGWLTFMQWFSFRFREERFNVTLSQPSDWLYDEYSVTDEFPSVYQAQNRMSDLEIGIIGSPDGKVHDTMVEVGFYHSLIVWPMIEYVKEQESRYTQFLRQNEIQVQGVYFALNTRPIPRLWPMETQFLVRFGGSLGLESRFKYEHEIFKRWFLGMELDASYRIISNYTDENDQEFIIEENNPRDVRYRFTIYSMFYLI